jgi:hypothetical protein
MSRIKRWLDKRRVVWSEPALPKYIKINPNSPPGAAEGLQPGDMSMLKVAEEFLEEPEEGLTLSGPVALPDVEAGDRASDQHALDLGRAFEDREVVRPGYRRLGLTFVTVPLDLAIC